MKFRWPKDKIPGDPAPLVPGFELKIFNGDVLTFKRLSEEFLPWKFQIQITKNEGQVGAWHNFENRSEAEKAWNKVLQDLRDGIL